MMGPIVPGVLNSKQDVLVQQVLVTFNVPAFIYKISCSNFT